MDDERQSSACRLGILFILACQSQRRTSVGFPQCARLLVPSRRCTSLYGSDQAISNLRCIHKTELVACRFLFRLCFHISPVRGPTWKCMVKSIEIGNVQHLYRLGLERPWTNQQQNVVVLMHPRSFQARIFFIELETGRITCHCDHAVEILNMVASNTNSLANYPICY